MPVNCTNWLVGGPGVRPAKKQKRGEGCIHGASFTPLSLNPKTTHRISSIFMLFTAFPASSRAMYTPEETVRPALSLPSQTAE